jgi:hypothetical protein
MKKGTIQLIFLLMTGMGLYAQEPGDALRYSWLQPSGTARSQAIGGAITSLGGDITSTFINPAGLGLYKTNEFVLTPGFQFANNKAGYLGTESKTNASKFNFGATGLVLALPGSRNGNWRNTTIGLAVNRTANFNNNLLYRGSNNQSSYSEKYLEELINNNVTDPNAAAANFPYGASLAFNTFLIDTVQGAGGAVSGYRSLATPQTGVSQQQVIETTGGITEYAVGISGNLKDKLYLGGSIGFSILNYEREMRFEERDETGNTNNDFNYFLNEEYLRTRGVGINAKLGAIFKPVEQLRIGLAVHTPTVYNLEDNYTAKITTDLEGYTNGVLSQSSIDFNDGLPGEFQYDFNNPWRFMAGVSYVFSEVADVTKQRGFISADVEFVNYTGGKFKEVSTTNNAGSYFNELNATIDDVYKSAVNARVGGELKFNTFMVRAGFAYFSNPYKGSDIKGSRMNLSGGLGYRNKGKFVDLTYVHQISKDGYYPYRLDQGFFAPVDLKSGIGNVLLTVGFKF